MTTLQALVQAEYAAMRLVLDRQADPDAVMQLVLALGALEDQLLPRLALFTVPAHDYGPGHRRSPDGRVFYSSAWLN